MHVFGGPARRGVVELPVELVRGRLPQIDAVQRSAVVLRARVRHTAGPRARRPRARSFVWGKVWHVWPACIRRKRPGAQANGRRGNATVGRGMHAWRPHGTGTWCATRMHAAVKHEHEHTPGSRRTPRTTWRGRAAAPAPLPPPMRCSTSSAAPGSTRATVVRCGASGGAASGPLRAAPESACGGRRSWRAGSAGACACAGEPRHAARGGRASPCNWQLSCVSAGWQSACAAPNHLGLWLPRAVRVGPAPVHRRPCGRGRRALAGPAGPRPSAAQVVRRPVASRVAWSETPSGQTDKTCPCAARQPPGPWAHAVGGRHHGGRASCCAERRPGDPPHTPAASAPTPSCPSRGAGGATAFKQSPKEAPDLGLAPP